MQAIQTKYLGPTNTKGSRIKAWCERGSVTVDYDQYSGVGAHDKAMKALISRFVSEDTEKYGTPAACPWIKHGWIRGGISTGYVYVADVASEKVLP
jgi:hypothetical protein